MLSVQLQIKASYENAGMTVEEISEDQSLDIASVKAALMQCSSKYRKACGIELKSNEEDPTLNFTDDELRYANRIIFELATTSEDDNIRFKAASYIRDDKKGRKEVVKHIAGNTFNILSFNEQMQQARAMAEEAKKRLIEV